MMPSQLRLIAPQASHKRQRQRPVEDDRPQVSKCKDVVVQILAVAAHPFLG